MSDQICPQCSGYNTRRATLYYQCMTCGKEFLAPTRTGDITTYEEARMTLEETVQCVQEDAGEDAAEAGYFDLVHTVAERCTHAVADELIRRNL